MLTATGITCGLDATVAQIDLQQWKLTSPPQYFVNSQKAALSESLAANLTVALPDTTNTKQHGHESKAMLFAEVKGFSKLGDGIFTVFNQVNAAADCALAMQESMALIDKAALGLPEELSLRIGLHLGPVYLTLDPITPEGCVYVTETFAAVLAALATGSNKSFACDYVGQTETAKNYGPMRMFLLRRTENSNATTVVLDFEK